MTERASPIKLSKLAKRARQNYKCIALPSRLFNGCRRKKGIETNLEASGINQENEKLRD